MSARLITNPAASWLYFSQPEVNTNGRRIPVPCGKLPGGPGGSIRGPLVGGWRLTPMNVEDVDFRAHRGLDRVAGTQGILCGPDQQFTFSKKSGRSSLRTYLRDQTTI